MYYALLLGETAVSTVISVRIPKKLKEKMDALKDAVNWSEEIRKFLEKRVEELHRRKILEEIRRILEEIPETPKGTAAKYVREDRDSY